MMYHIMEVKNKSLIKKQLEKHYDALVYDGSPSFEDFVPSSDNIWFFCLKDKEICGIITFEYINYVLWMPHIVINKEHRGKGSTEWGRQAIQRMEHRYGAKKFLALTPYLNAKQYAERVGFKYVTTLHNSIKKNGRLLDQYMLEK